MTAVQPEPASLAARPEPGTGTAAARRLPFLPRTHVTRSLLCDQLERSSDGPLTLVVAPGGAGKTLGVAGWLHATDRLGSTLWTNATPTLDVAQLHALLQEQRHGCPDRDGQEPGRRRLLVIDDAHRLPNSALVHLDRELDQHPDRLHLLLLSRWDLPISRLVPELLSHLTVIRGDTLRLSRAEASRLVAVHARASAPQVEEAILARSEGWAAAVVLAAKAIGADPDPSAAAERYRHGGPSAVDRITSEVFGALQGPERHLLLCTSSEASLSPSVAAELTQNPRAGEILVALEATGLLVTRHHRSATRPDDGLVAEEGSLGPADSADDVEYRIHPLLVEVVRRRLAAGGVDVEQARGTVRRAARLDRARGNDAQAFDRLTAVGEAAEAAHVLAAEGLTLVLRGHGPRIRVFARQHGAAVDADPGCWPALVLERWLAGDLATASHWLARIQAGRTARARAAEASADSGRDAVVEAWVRLLRARLGEEPLAEALDRGALLAAAGEQSPDPLLALLHLELGIVRTWLGDLDGAGTDLTAAVLASRAHHLPALTAEALGHLSVAQYLQDREHVSLELARDVDRLATAHPWLPTVTTGRARLVLDLISLQDLPWPDAPDDLVGRAPAVHTADLTAKFLARSLQARQRLVAGSVADAVRLLDAPLEAPALPEHLRRRALVERGIQAALAADRDALDAIRAQLHEVDADGYASLIGGLRADLTGDLRRAGDLFALAGAPGACPQPGLHAMAVTCHAQLLDRQGRGEEALVALQDAVTATEIRRDAVPFLGWSRLGSPIQELLERLDASRPNRWTRQLAEAASRHPGLTAFFGPVTATPRERAQVPSGVVRPVLTPREREVLQELARGATYADIAGTLFVSENTVKTHVSSLYARLAVTRRSEALAVARTLHLL